VVTEPQKDLVAVLDDVVDGEPDDPAERLGVEEEQGRDDAVHQRELLVGEEASEQGKPAMLVHRCGVARGDDGDLEAGHALGAHAPAQELLGWPPGDAVVGVPGVEVSLFAFLGQVAALSEPVQELQRLDHLPAGIPVPAGAYRLTCCDAAQLPEYVPGCILLQQLALLEVVDGGKMAGQPLPYVVAGDAGAVDAQAPAIVGDPRRHALRTATGAAAVGLQRPGLAASTCSGCSAASLAATWRSRTRAWISCLRGAPSPTCVIC